MTPKEKAQELIDKFYQTTPNEAWVNEPLGLSTEYKAWEQAKQCANIAVKEILRVAFYADDWLYNHFLEVKQEIDKL